MINFVVYLAYAIAISKTFLEATLTVNVENTME